MLQTYTIGSRTYHIYIPNNPPQQYLPAIIVFHGSGGHWQAMARHWGIDSQNPVPPLVENYLLVFPEADQHLSHRWVHHKEDAAFPDYDLLFVDALVNDLTTLGYPAGGGTVYADPNLLYAAGFSNGGAMVWQIAYSDRVGRFQGFASVARSLDAEKVAAYNHYLGGAAPSAIPFIYIHGTADQSFSADLLHCPAPEYTASATSVLEMLNRNNIPLNAPATTQLISGSANITEVVMQLFVGTEAFCYVAILGGGHHWVEPSVPASPTVASHFNSTRAIVEFWKNHAGLP